MFNIKKSFHKHDFQIYERSNVIQYDDMGYPLRLYIEKCDCGKSRQSWIDTHAGSISTTDVVLKWTKIIPKKITPMSKCARIQENEDANKESN